MKNAIIKMALVGGLLAGTFEASSAPLSTLYIDDYYEVLKKRYYTTSMPSTGLPSKNTYLSLYLLGLYYLVPCRPRSQ